MMSVGHGGQAASARCSPKGEPAEPLLRVQWGEASAIVSFIRLFCGRLACGLRRVLHQYPFALLRILDAVKDFERAESLADSGTDA